MRSTLKVMALAATCFATTPLVAQQSGAFEFTIASIMRGPEHYGREPQNPRFTPDNQWIYFNWLPPGSAWNESLKPYRVRALAGARPEEVTKAHMDSVAPLIANGVTSADRTQRVVSVEGDLWLVDLRRSTARRLTETPTNETSPVFSADGKEVFFLRDGLNVMALQLDGPLMRQLSDFRTGGAQPSTPKLSEQRTRLQEQQKDLFEVIRDEARLDSVRKAEREAEEAERTRTMRLGNNERLAQLAVSPSGRALIFTAVTNATTRQTMVPEWVTMSGYTEELNVRTKVGDAQSSARLGFMELPSGKVTWLKAIPADSTIKIGNIRTFGWNTSGSNALVVVDQADNKARYLNSVDDKGSIKTIDVIRDSAWVAGPCNGCGGFIPGTNRAWFVNEADGFAHLYTINADGSDKKQLTRGKWEVLGARISDDGRFFELHTSEVSPFERQFYRMPIAGGASERITTQVGGHDVEISPNGQFMLDVFSEANAPPELFVGPYRPGATLSRLTVSPTQSWRAHSWIKPEIVHFTASDGVQVPARIYRPRDVGGQPNGAAVIFVHGAGYLHNVHNYWSSYSREYMFNHFLASKGYVVLDIDYRASAGYGRDWRTAIYRWMGGRDLADHVDGSRYLQREFGINPERIGLYGGSYGGFMTLMALFNAPKEFGAGAALRSVTDWAHYNHGYTSRILNQPQDDTLAYRQSSPIYFAEGLEDPLLMAHGMVDVNVHFQDIVRLTQRLIELGKTNWELAVYPVEDHGFVRPSSWADEYRRIFELFENNLGPDRVSAGSGGGGRR